MKIKLREDQLADIRDKLDNWPASRLNAKDLRNDLRALLEHTDAVTEELADTNEKEALLREWAREMPTR